MSVGTQDVGHDVEILAGPAAGAIGMLWDVMDDGTCSVKRWQAGRQCAAETYDVRHVRPLTLSRQH